MKANNQNLPPNKKLIIHFDIENVIRLPNVNNKDLYVYNLCAQWVWGKLEKNSKEDPDKITGWKLGQNTLVIEQPDPEMISYSQYLDQYLKPTPQQRQNLILNLSKGPAAKAKNQIEKNIKNITVPKTLYQALKESTQNSKIGQKYLATGKYQILPAFYKTILALKKAKRQFAVIIKSNNDKDRHDVIIEQLNMFFKGQHPLYNGSNGTPLVKMDGSKGIKNFVFGKQNYGVLYKFGDTELFQTYGTVDRADPDIDLQMFKQRLKNLKNIKFCDGNSQIYSLSHSLLAEAACVYEVNPYHYLVLDQVDYQTQEIYFTNSETAQVYSCLGQPVQDVSNIAFKVSLFDMLKDIDYFTKKIEKAQELRVKEIQKRQKGQIQPNEEQVQGGQEQEVEKQKQIPKQRQSNSEYLKKNLLPVLEIALRQVDLVRPDDPISFIALQCLKYRQRLEN